MTLTEIANIHGTDKGCKDGQGHNYCRVYERYFESFRQEAFNLLEIGVAEGKSIRMWLDYFPNAQIVGMEGGGDPPTIHSRYRHVLGDARYPILWQELPEFRVVVDDASHLCEQIKATFEIGWPRVKRGGLWIVEDLHCAYSPDYDLGRPTALDWVRGLIDLMNDQGKGMTGNPDNDGSDIAFVHFWKSLIIIGKK